MVPSFPIKQKEPLDILKLTTLIIFFNKRRHQFLQMCEGEELQMTIKKLDENFQVQKI